jgi:hypothetical protein
MFREQAMMRILAVFLSGVLVMVQSGCHARSSVPIVNVEDQAIVREDGKALTAEQVKRAIIIAGSADKKLKWDISEEKEGHFVAKLVVRGKHTAVADILYSPTRLSIKYRDSTNLNFEKDKEGRGLIHPNYNRWINDLLRAIMAEIQRVK